VQNAPKEEQLSIVTLSPEAEARLGVETVRVERRVVDRAIELGAEVMAAPGLSNVVTAPLAGTLLRGEGPIPAAGSVLRRGQVIVRLAPLPPAGDVAAAEIRLQAAKTRASRTEELLREGATSRRALEEARTELDLAEAAARAGRAPALDASEGLPIVSPQEGVLGDLRVGIGQTVAAGALLFQVEDLSRVWVRVPVYVGDVARVAAQRPATVRPLSASSAERGWEAAPVDGPPSANSDAVTSDLYYELPNPDGALRPGQRVAVSLPLGRAQESLVMPWAAVLYDIHGGTWAYEQISPHRYSRRRVEVDYVTGELAVLARGPVPGTVIVSVGAAEIFGTEFGTGK
jgi:RND family efflux transporter MFP subunit